MPVFAPARRPAFAPLNRLRSSPLSGGKKSTMAALNLTAMVDMFTTIVIFLLASFQANGDILFILKDLELPKAVAGKILAERGPVVTLFENTVLMEGNPFARLDEISKEDQGVPLLGDKLKAIREHEEKIAEMAGKPRDPTKPFEGIIVVQADKETDFELVRKVIYSANEGGWAKIHFAVTGGGGPKPADEGHGGEG
jgi:biopolymer transport protein ExbD